MSSTAPRDATRPALLIIDVRSPEMHQRPGSHGAGDRALRLVAESLRQTCRTRDYATRWAVMSSRCWLPATARQASCSRSAFALRCGDSQKWTLTPSLVVVSNRIADIAVAMSRRPERSSVRRPTRCTWPRRGEGLRDHRLTAARRNGAPRTLDERRKRMRTLVVSAFDSADSAHPSRQLSPFDLQEG